ncbi:hypothetical protein [Demequina sp. SO4-18]|uniref:hypothetical protein n=1 Tax=Demequina sp. SO4-18 TaxID=3401026 RepID=UPI003B5C4BAC
MLLFSHDTSAADWIAGSSTRADQLITFGPDAYGSFARVRFIPDPARPGLTEADAQVPADHPTNLDHLVRAVEALTPFTGTPDAAFFLVWDSGVSTIAADARARSAVHVPHRESFLSEGGLADLPRWCEDLGLDEYDHPSFIWPADRAWCIAADVDPHWAGVGATEAAIEALLGDPGVDSARADPAQRQPTYY